MTAPDPRTLSDADLLDRHERSIIEGDERAYLPLRAELCRRLADRDRLREALGQILARAVLALRDTNLAIAVVDLYQIEGGARAALVASGVTVGD